MTIALDYSWREKESRERERWKERGEREGKRKSNIITCFENLLLVMFENPCEIESFGRLGGGGDGLVGTKCKGGGKVGGVGGG